MVITWLGHSSFKIQTKTKNSGLNPMEVTIVTDPFDNSIGLKMPKIQADIVTVSHDHADHNNINAIKGEPFIIDSVGEYEVKSNFIWGVKSFHDTKEGEERGRNVIYVIEAEGMKLAHLGDLGHVLTEKQLPYVKDVDILFIPIGGVYTIDAKQAVEVISQIEPRIIIPMHYKVTGLKVKLDGIDKFCKEIGVCERPVDKLKITKKEIPQEETKVIIMKS